MTVKEMLNKIEKVNKLNDELGLNKVMIRIERNMCLLIESSNMKTIKKWIEERLLLETMEQFLSHDFNNNELFAIYHKWFDGEISVDCYNIEIINA